MDYGAVIQYVSGPMKRRVAFLAVFVAVLLWVADSVQIGAAAKPLTATQMFDEFGAAGHCDLTARLDNFAIVLQALPTASGYIVSYGPEGDGPGAGRSPLPLLKDYLINARGLADDRIKTVYGGRNDVLQDPKIQLWIVPLGETFPKPRKYQTNIDTFKGMFYEQESDDFMDVYLEGEGEVMGPGLGRPIGASFADMLQQQKKAVPYVVIYNGESAVPGAARRLAAGEIEDLKLHKVDVSRVKTIFGGVRKKTTLQLWITPPGDPAPVADAGPELPPTKNAQITSQADSSMGDPRNERPVFNRMLEVLRSQPTVKAVAVITLEGPQEEPEPDSAPLPPQILEEGEPALEDIPPADLPKLVQKWRDELTNTHKINPERFIVLFHTSSDLAGNYLDLWIVPPGQPLPDPNADEKEFDESAYKIYENLPPSVTSTMGYRLGALIRDPQY